MATVPQIIEHEDYNEAVLHHKAWMEGPQQDSGAEASPLPIINIRPQGMSEYRRAHEATLL
jgi:hypothetical protein